MYYSNDEIGKTVSLITSAPKDLEVNNVLVKDVRHGYEGAIVTAITSLSVVVCHTKALHGGKLFETAILKEDLSRGWNKLDAIRYLPNDGGWVMAYINRCVVRGWWKKAYEYATEFSLMWWLEKQCEYIVDGLDIFLEKNKLSLAGLHDLKEKEDWKEGQEFTEKQLKMIQKAKGE